MRHLLEAAFCALAITLLSCACSSGSSGADDEASGGSGGGGASSDGGALGSGNVVTGPDHWVGTWGASQQLTEPDNNPPEPGLANTTLRQRAFVSIGGSELRVQLSNEFGDGPVTMNSVHVAATENGADIDTSTDVELTFSASSSVTIPEGEAVYSDPFDFALAELSSVAISIHFGDVPDGITGHPGSRTTSRIVEGDAVAAETLTDPVTTTHWYYISKVEVMAPANAAAVVTLGDSLTDGYGSRVNHDTRWPDYLSRRLRANPSTELVAVINAGIGGNAVVSGGLGPTARERFERDVLGQAGVSWVIVLEGVNDVGYGGSADSLIAAYEELIASAHAADVLIYGVPLPPFGGSSYDSEAHEQERQILNEWVRTSGAFDAVIDVEEAVADPENVTQLLPIYTVDGLHLNMTGYEAMAEAIDLTLFEWSLDGD